MATRVEVEYRNRLTMQVEKRTVMIDGDLVGAPAVISKLTGQNVVQIWKSGSSFKWKCIFKTGIENIDATIELLKLKIRGAHVSIGENRYGSFQNFKGCESLREVTIDAPSCEINDGAFSQCTSLESVVIPDSVTSIGEHAFFGCEKLKNLRLPTRLRSIGEEAFWRCKSLGDITLPYGIATIGKGAFHNSELKYVRIPSTVDSIGDGAFWSLSRSPIMVVYGKDDDMVASLTQALRGEGYEVVLDSDAGVQTLLQSKEIDSSCRNDAKSIAEAAPMVGRIDGHIDFSDDPDALWKYLKVVSEAETSVLQLTEALALAISTKRRLSSALDARRKYDKHSNFLERERLRAEANRQRIEYNERRTAILAGETLTVFDLGPAPTDPRNNPEPEKPKPPILEKPGLFNRKKVEASNAVMEARYQEALSEYEEKLSQRKRALEQYKEDLAAWRESRDKAIKLKLDMLGPFRVPTIDTPESEESETAQELEAACAATDAMCEELKKQLSDASGLLKLAYSADVIFPKYRNIEAMTTIYEYFETGRCSSLRGPDGAYNLYESELRSNVIIGKLDVVSDKLDAISDQLSSIQASQYVLYKAVEGIGERLDSISGTLESILDETSATKGAVQDLSSKTAALVRNSAEIAYWSRKNAELTDSLGYLIAFTGM